MLQDTTPGTKLRTIQRERALMARSAREHEFELLDTTHELDTEHVGGEGTLPTRSCQCNLLTSPENFTNTCKAHILDPLLLPLQSLPQKLTFPVTIMLCVIPLLYIPQTPYSSQLTEH